MLFYVMLTIAGVVTAALVVWIIKSVSEAGRAAYQTLSPASRGRSRSRLAHLNQNLATAPSPWGWSPQDRGTPSVTPLSETSGHHSPVPRVRDREPPTLTSQGLRASNLQLLMDGIKDPSPIGSARNVLTGYDLGKRDQSESVATTNWPYHTSEGQDAGQEEDVPAVKSQARTGGSAETRSSSRHSSNRVEKPRQDERQPANLRPAGLEAVKPASDNPSADKPWGW